MTIHELKEESHRLIELLVARGISRGTIYTRLSLVLGVTSSEMHFSKLTNRGKLESALSLLQSWQKKEYKKRPHVERKEDVLPLAQQKAALAKLRQEAYIIRPPWWKRLWKLYTGRL